VQPEGMECQSQVGAFQSEMTAGLQAVKKQKPISVHSAARLILKQRCGSPLDMAFILFDKIAN
jgi:hypothetical protein